MCVENCFNRKINVLVGSCPRTNTDPHGGPSSPCGASAPASAGVLDRSDDASRPIIIPETDDHLIQDNIVQDLEKARWYLDREIANLKAKAAA